MSLMKGLFIACKDVIDCPVSGIRCSICPSLLPLQVAYSAWLSRALHARGLSAGLKNSLEMLPQLHKMYDFFVNEQCNGAGPSYDQASTISKGYSFHCQGNIAFSLIKEELKVSSSLVSFVYNTTCLLAQAQHVSVRCSQCVEARFLGEQHNVFVAMRLASRICRYIITIWVLPR